MTAPRQPRRASALLLCLLLVPLTAGAQPAGTSFGELISALPPQAELTVVDTPTRVGRGIAVTSHLRLPDVSGIAPERSFLQAQGRATGSATRSRRGRMGALVGLAAGTAAATLYWANSNCRYGSDSAAAVVTHCVVPSGAMIAGGWYVGRMVGRGQSQNTP